MKITNIKQQVKRADRYSVYIDGKFSFALSETGLLQQGLYTGQELTAQQLAALKDDSVRDKARYLALGQLSRRMRSEWELRDYLKRKGYTPEIIAQTIEWLAEYGYINDKQFADAWVANRRLLKATSLRRLRQELRQKHVSDDVINETLAEDDTDERQTLRDLIKRKQKQTKYQDKLKLMQYLARQGFNYDDIKSVLDEAY
ncbi:MAG TPA: RecX family transcriptional regulator [Candidatus Limnocylindrales bacterium]|nr:RecX family transcriptional regulator [Candidatus Limnocylindrales bacterium]